MARMRARVQLNVGAVMAQIDKALEPGLVRCTRYMVNYAKVLVSEPYPPSSDPGHPPHKRSGRLQAGIRAEKLSIKKRLVVSEAYRKQFSYAWALTRGTPFAGMRPRPYMEPTIMDTLPALPSYFKDLF